MSYEILYGCFIVDSIVGNKIPYIICGSNNVWYAHSFSNRGKRSRDMYNLFEIYKKKDSESLDDLLGRVFDDLDKARDSWRYLPKTKNGFIRKFHRNEIPWDTFTDNAEWMDMRLHWH